MEKEESSQVLFVFAVIINHTYFSHRFLLLLCS